MYILNVDPPTRFNNVVNWDDEILSIFNRHQGTIDSKYIENLGVKSAYLGQLPGLQTAFVHVITEHTYHYPHVSLTEKAFRGITCKRPFIMLAPAGSLKEIKRLGFKTFDSWWDESYDSELDPSKRLKMVVKLIEDISSMDLSSVQKMCADMKDVLEYNYNFYVNDFETCSLEDFKRQLESC